MCKIRGRVEKNMRHGLPEIFMDIIFHIFRHNMFARENS